MTDEIRAAAEQSWDDDEIPTVLYVCVQNAGRSQMAAAYTRELSNGRVRVLSAGMSPAQQVHPEVVQAMLDDGIDLRGETPTQLTDELAEQAHVIITMGCDDQSPCLTGRRTIEWPLDDPADQSPETTRRIRDEIRGRVTWLLIELGDPDLTPPPVRDELAFAVDPDAARARVRPSAPDAPTA